MCLPIFLRSNQHLDHPSILHQFIIHPSILHQFIIYPPFINLLSIHSSILYQFIIRPSILHQFIIHTPFINLSSIHHPSIPSSLLHQFHPSPSPCTYASASVECLLSPQLCAMLQGVPAEQPRPWLPGTSPPSQGRRTPCNRGRAEDAWDPGEP